MVEPGAEEDIASDLSVFHRIDNPDDLDGPRYFRLAERLMFYPGAVAARFRVAIAQQQEAPAPIPRQVSAEPVEQVNDAAALAAMTKNNRGLPTIGYRS